MRTPGQMMDHFVGRRRTILAAVMDAHPQEFRRPLGGGHSWAEATEIGAPLMPEDQVATEKMFNLLASLYREAGTLFAEPDPEKAEEEREVMKVVAPNPMVLHVAREIYGEAAQADEFARSVAAFQYYRAEGRYRAEGLLESVFDAIDDSPGTTPLDLDLKRAAKELALLQINLLLGEQVLDS